MPHPRREQVGGDAAGVRLSESTYKPSIAEHKHAYTDADCSVHEIRLPLRTTAPYYRGVKKNQGRQMNEIKRVRKPSKAMTKSRQSMAPSFFRNYVGGIGEKVNKDDNWNCHQHVGRKW